jgi:four helix bundle protein
MRDQLSRAILSVVNNLAEGSAKSSIKDRARFYEISLASFRESQAMLHVLNRLDLLEKYDLLGASLYKLRKNTLSHCNQVT